jgi:hypothetical protein
MKQWLPGIKKQWYVGLVRNGLEAFRSELTPTETKYGMVYKCVVGPFKTRRAALWAEKYGYNNPHFQTVKDAERISAQK